MSNLMLMPAAKIAFRDLFPPGMEPNGVSGRTLADAEQLIRARFVVRTELPVKSAARTPPKDASETPAQR